MKREGIINAAIVTMNLAKLAGMHRTVVDSMDHPTGWAHLLTMVDRMVADADMTDGKLNRWLGWIQACVCMCDGQISLDVMKGINMTHRDDERILPWP